MQNKVSIVRIVLKTKDGRCLLLRRAEKDTIAHRYELPGGKIEIDSEDLTTTLRRELLEETGLTLSTAPTMLHALTEEYEGRQYIILGFLMDIDAPLRVHLSEEHDDAVWLTPQEMMQLKFTTHTAEIVRAAFEGTPTSDNTDVKESTNVSELIIYTDGGSRGNPGPSASGYVIMNTSEHILEEGGEYLGVTTNNQAEYQAVRLALEKAKKYHPNKVTFRLDSELVVRQMNGQYQIKNRDLWPVHARIQELIAHIKRVRFTHVYRERNTLADAKVNEILDNHMP